jgi:hypothetical protein
MINQFVRLLLYWGKIQNKAKYKLLLLLFFFLAMSTMQTYVVSLL